VRIRRAQKEQLGTEPEVLNVLVVTLVPVGVTFELSRNTMASWSLDCFVTSRLTLA
jgi:hypothetical protein